MKFIWTVSWLTWWAFLGLKLSGAVAWSWWTVAIPLYVVGAQSVLGIILLSIIGAGAAVAVKRSGSDELAKLMQRDLRAPRRTR